MELLELSLAAQREAIATKRISARELVRLYLDRIARLDGALGAYLAIDEAGALAAADAVDAGRATGPLAGVPIAVKDVLVTRGVATTAASKILAGWIPPYDGTAIGKLRAAGAILIGKLNCDEFAMGSSTERSAYKPCANPWDATRVPGGSSGGSAAAVAARLCAASLGTDTGGSIRQPAALCGVVGMKPTYGRVSRYGLVAFASSLDQVGPLARSVEDAAVMLEVIAGVDPLDATSIDAPVPRFSGAVGRGAKGLRVGLPREYFPAELDASVRAGVERAADALRDAGAEVRDVCLPHTKLALPTYYLIAPAEAASNLARYDGVRYGARVDAPTLVEMYARTRGAGFGPEVKRRIMLGTYALRTGYYDAYYRKAQEVRALITRDFARAFEDVDVVLTPTTPAPAFAIGATTTPLEMYLADVFTLSCNLAGLPGISIPCGRAGALPIGAQVMGRALDEETVIAAAAVIERALGPLGPPPGCVVTAWEPVIGLEVHVQLATASKAFSASAIEFGAPPNALTDPTVLGLPGALPVFNARAAALAVRLGLATGSTIRTRSRFARKHYFYPDLPKGYQISQYDEPLCEGGAIDVVTAAGVVRVPLVRIHLEEDAGKNMHHGAVSHVDLDRAGVPLVEVVTGPEITSADDAAELMRSLHRLVRWLEISEADMEKGQMRCDANVSVRRAGEPLGTRTELKNINSFRFVHRAIQHEIARQTRILDGGGRVERETRLWDADADQSFPLRSKEEANDYRYFPDPDLPPLVIAEADIAATRGALPELPAARWERLRALGLSADDARQLIASRAHGDYLDGVLAAVPSQPKLAAAWVLGELAAALNRDGTDIAASPLGPAALGELLALIADGTISGKIAKDVFERAYASRESPAAIVEREGLRQVSDEGALVAIAERILAANAKQVAAYRSGKTALLGFFVGQLMKETGGTANPQLASSILKRLLDG